MNKPNSLAVLRRRNQPSKVLRVMTEKTPQTTDNTPRRMTFAHVSRTIERDGKTVAASRAVPEEVPVALSFGGTTHAVMMASPSDLQDFAIGFSLSERIISDKDDITSMDINDVGEGLDIQMQLKDDLQSEFSAKRRAMAGPVGCGLCGIESIEDVMRELPKREENTFSLEHSSIAKAIDQLNNKQEMRAETGAVHAAAFINYDGDIKVLREDVGRHNALDKTIGAIAINKLDATSGAIVITSRVSVDLIQKVVVSGAPILIAVSTPTALAIRTAKDAGLTLIALARKDSFEIYTRPERIRLPRNKKEENADVA